MLDMASYTGGYDCEFVEKPPKIVQGECPVCLQILREPHQADCCGYAFCQVCIEQIKADNKPCPCCKAKKFNKFEDKRLKRTLDEFKVYCTNKEQGCQWTGELSQLDKHLNYNPSQEKWLHVGGCQFIQVKCHYCSKLVQRSSIKFHQGEQCSRRPFSCQYCMDFNSTYEAVTTNHWPECGYYPVQCTNRCGKSIKRKYLKSHISNDCPLTVINCEFSHMGCEVKLPRKDMAAHLTENMVKHVSLQAESYRQLKDENELLKQQMAQLTQDLKLQQICTPICPAEFTMTNFEQHKMDHDEWFSPPFYTHPKGYKFCMSVVANGCGKREGTHASVGICLMKGEFDDQLKWPFRGCITVHLLSQVSEEHQKTKIPFTGTEPSYDSVANRVLAKGRDRADTATAVFNFISHTNLLPKYLKHDCLKLRVCHNSIE